MTPQAWLNGRPAGSELAHHRGLHYGDGIFRTCLILSSHLLDEEGHLRKAADDAAVLGMAVDMPQLRQEVHIAVRGQDRGVLKIILARAGVERGYRSASGEADRLICRYPGPVLPRDARQGVRTARSALRLAAQPALAGIKHLNRLEQVLASRDWPAGVEEVVLCDEEGRPHCGTRTNLFWVSQGVVRTPALERSGVAGLMRARVLAAAAALGVPTEVAPGSWDELEASDEAFLTNSLIGIWPIATLDGRRWPSPGSLTQRLAAALRHPELG